MKDRELLQLGFAAGPVLQSARACAESAAAAGLPPREIRKTLRMVKHTPQPWVAHAQFGALARLLAGGAEPLAAPALGAHGGAPWRQWGEKLDPRSIEQMRNACALPVAVRGALMPDAHPGYGLPIGGVLATRGAVIPYAVGVDIACRMKMTVLDLPPETLDTNPEPLRRAIEQEALFGVGAQFKQRRQHAVMDADWQVSPVTRDHKDKAWGQLGTSGSGNHFVEFGELEVLGDGAGLVRGVYLALLSHSGSRGTGALVCEYYSKVAKAAHRELPGELQHLAWLDLDSGAGQEYWAAMQLMGRYAAANHELIHRHIARNLGVPVLLDIENHHNFAWKETHDGEELVVHRKGATPTGSGALGIIPGSMATPGYVVRGKGNEEALLSASHGAGRVMSRTQAKKTFRWRDGQALLDRNRVTVMSAGLDELPMVYKDIDTVMAAQEDLVEVLARFQPRLVKMCPAGDAPED